MRWVGVGRRWCRVWVGDGRPHPIPKVGPHAAPLQPRRQSEHAPVLLGGPGVVRAAAPRPVGVAGADVGCLLLHRLEDGAHVACRRREEGIFRLTKSIPPIHRQLADNSLEK